MLPGFFEHFGQIVQFEKADADPVEQFFPVRRIIGNLNLLESILIQLVSE